MEINRSEIIARAIWLAEQGVAVYPYCHDDTEDSLIRYMPKGEKRVYVKPDDIESVFSMNNIRGIMAFTGMPIFGNEDNKKYLIVYDVDKEEEVERVKSAFGEDLSRCLLEKGNKGIHICFFTNDPMKTQREEETKFGDILGKGNLTFMFPSISHKKNNNKYSELQSVNEIGFIGNERINEINKILGITKKQELIPKTFAQENKEDTLNRKLSRKVKPDDPIIGLSLERRQPCPFHEHKNPPFNDLQLNFNEDGSWNAYCHSKGDYFNIIQCYAVKNSLSYQQAKSFLYGEFISKSPYQQEFDAVKEMLKGKYDSMEFFVKKETIIEDHKADQTVNRLNEYFIYTEKGIRVVKKIVIISKEENKTKREIRNILEGNLKVLANIIYINEEKTNSLWKISFNDREYTSTLDEIISFLQNEGASTGTKEEMKQFLSQYIQNTDIPKIKAYSCVGLFFDEETKSLNFANDENHVMPNNDIQQQFMLNYKRSSLRAYSIGEAEMLKASNDFIASMPSKNRLQALIVRGFSMIAPLSYEIRKRKINIFPYLYLYGQSGSSKTQIADCSSTFIFGGDLIHLNDNSVGSTFRLGMEFTATTFPRLIDESQSTFMKNLEIFKSSATSTLATKRGNVNKKMDSYIAYCPFIFTGNGLPISVEEDVNNGLLDRIIILECYRGKDFNQDTNLKAFSVFQNSGFILGKMIANRLMDAVNNVGLDQIENKIEEIGIAISKQQQIPIRKAYTLAIIIMGIKMYHKLLQDYGIDAPIKFHSDEEMVKKIIEMTQKISKSNESEFIHSFISYVISVCQTNRYTNKEGVTYYDFGRIKNEGIELKSSRDWEMIITRNALLSYAKKYNIKNMNIKTLPELSNELKKLNEKVDVEPKTHKVFGHCVHGINIKLSELFEDESLLEKVEVNIMGNSEVDVDGKMQS